MRSRIVSVVVFAALLAAPSAGAHVTLNPNEAEAGGFARFAIRAPNERPNADTTKVSVQIPEGLFFVSFQPKAGWERAVKIEKLAEPVELFGQEITERVASVTWSGGLIKPGEFDEFGMSARVPEEGEELVFPAIQTYSNGEVVRWIGEPETETPAPRVTLLSPEEEGAQPTSAEGTAAPAADEAPSDKGRVNLALGLGGAGLVAGLAALGAFLVGQRRRA